MKDAFIVGNSVLLRPVRESDLPLFVQWVNDPDVRKYMLTRSPMTEMAEKEWIAKGARHSRYPEDIAMVIEIKESQKPIGTIGLHSINWIDRCATTGSMIGDVSEQRKGYATDAKMHVLKYAFEVLGMHKIISLAYAKNERSIAYSERCGYEREALLREEVFREGAWEDIVRLACFAKPWKVKWNEYVRSAFRFPSQAS